MVRYPDTLSLLKARALFFRDAKLGPHGGYSDRWVHVETKPIPFYFPNWPSRVAAARLHDLHHIATDYETDWPGEAETAAWEIASGCARYHAARILNFGAFGGGLVVHRGEFFARSCADATQRQTYIRVASMNRGLMISQSECCAINSGCVRRFHPPPVPPTFGCSLFGASHPYLPGCCFRF